MISGIVVGCNKHCVSTFLDILYNYAEFDLIFLCCEKQTDLGILLHYILADGTSKEFSSLWHRQKNESNRLFKKGQ